LSKISGVLYLQLLEAAQSLIFSLTRLNETDLETDAKEKEKKDVINDADKLKSADGSSLVRQEMDPDEV
jgi:hypothetical protein